MGNAAWKKHEAISYVSHLSTTHTTPLDTNGLRDNVR